MLFGIRLRLDNRRCTAVAVHRSMVGDITVQTPAFSASSSSHVEVGSLGPERCITAAGIPRRVYRWIILVTIAKPMLRGAAKNTLSCFSTSFSYFAFMALVHFTTAPARLR